MTEPSDDPTKSRTDIVGSLTTAVRQPSFLRVMLVLAATVVVLVGMRLGAPIFWAWLLGSPGAFLALPITLFVADVFDTFPEARLMMISSATGARAPGVEVEPSLKGGLPSFPPHKMVCAF